MAQRAWSPPPRPSLVLGSASLWGQRAGCHCVPSDWHAHCTGVLEGNIKEREWRGQTEGETQLRVLKLGFSDLMDSQ